MEDLVIALLAVYMFSIGMGIIVGFCIFFGARIIKHRRGSTYAEYDR